MPRRTDVPGTSYSASKPNAGTNLGKYHLMLIIFPIKKIEKQREYNAPQALSGDTELTARAANVLNSV